MVIKTEVCFYTEMKIWPGHGRSYVRKDGKLLTFLSRKAFSLYHQKIKAQKLTWTQAWRRRNKKGKIELSTRRRVKKGGKVFKSIQGVSVDELKKKVNMNPAVRKAQRETALREVKERKKKTRDEKKKIKSKDAGKGTKAVNKGPRNLGIGSARR